MAMQNTSNDKPAPLPIISDEKEEVILGALKTLHGALVAYGATLPDFDACGPKEYDRVFSRATRALNALHEHRKEEKVAAFRTGVADVVAPYVDDARKARDAYMQLPKETRAYMPAFPATVAVPVGAVSHLFPQGTDEGKIIGVLRTLKYEVGKSDGKTYIKAPLSTPAAK